MHRFWKEGQEIWTKNGEAIVKRGTAILIKLNEEGLADIEEINIRTHTKMRGTVVFFVDDEEDRSEDDDEEGSEDDDEEGSEDDDEEGSEDDDEEGS
ncbi:hypothetical protein BLNAU_4811 [Blattamonas nauphoetae]|uniref:Uncharacterized protein n=1 Tax=Blattamonas nauphoetae TaxID=2049346 RepID=A0ABQ9Y926_9EUKA|nr:hypothetical protein BLNAU_4811 [Blattamonas nauphoetae]